MLEDDFFVNLSTLMQKIYKCHDTLEDSAKKFIALKLGRMYYIYDDLVSNNDTLMLLINAIQDNIKLAIDEIEG